MKTLMQVLTAFVLAAAVSGGISACAKKKVKPEAESNESRKGRQWNYEEAEKNRAKVPGETEDTNSNDDSDESGQEKAQ